MVKVIVKSRATTNTSYLNVIETAAITILISDNFKFCASIFLTTFR